MHRHTCQNVTIYEEIQRLEPSGLRAGFLGPHFFFLMFLNLNFNFIIYKVEGFIPPKLEEWVPLGLVPAWQLEALHSDGLCPPPAPYTWDHLSGPSYSHL